jgi:hypothetical protein
MDKLIAQLNIEHFLRKLAEETNPAQRQTILRLLADEEKKLAAIGAAQPQPPSTPASGLVTRRSAREFPP